MRENANGQWTPKNESVQSLDAAIFLPRNDRTMDYVARGVPNQELNQDQRQEKKDLKARLKLESRKRKYQTRHEHALRRKDHAAAEQALRDLETIMQRERKESNLAGKDMPLDDNRISPLEQHSRKLIESLYHDVQRKLTSLEKGESSNSFDNEATDNSKEFQTEQARWLLRSMTKGTQNLSMFDNDAALRGYVRQKFFERAVLVAHSLSKLIPEAGLCNGVGTTTPTNRDQPVQNTAAPTFGKEIATTMATTTCKDRQMRLKLWKRLQSVRTVVSIGCGPGCDGAGIAAWMAAAKQHKCEIGEQDKFRLQQLVLLDWAMPKWKSIVDPLVDTLVLADLVNDVQSGICDVLSNKENATHNQTAFAHCVDADLIITSYLLSETRGRWFDFYGKVVEYCVSSSSTRKYIGEPLTNSLPRGTLFLFTDPTAWQLHEWLNRYEEHLEGWCWLDSSMNKRDLQILEGRVGPAVLLAMTKPKPRDSRNPAVSMAEKS